MSGTGERILNKVGLGLLVLCICLSLFRIVVRTTRDLDPHVVTIRLAHFNLEVGMRETLRTISQEYTNLHPNVRIEQVVVPESLYSTWATTQLVGGTAPDIIMLAPWQGLGSDKIRQYFSPLGTSLSQPNPYNKGTPMEGVAWRDTFIDGLNNYPAYESEALDYYGVGLYTGSVRLFYNKQLMKDLTGQESPPATFQDFIKVGDTALNYRDKRGKQIIPVAASRETASGLLNQLFSTVMQKYDWTEVDPATSYTCMTDGATEEWGAAYLRGSFKLDSPETLAALEITRRTTRLLQPGFLQLQRDDASSAFIQGRALMLLASSYDWLGMKEECSFDLGVFRLPTPSADDPDYGKWIKGPDSEGGSTTGGILGLTNTSKHPEVAIDFLRFLTSVQSNEEMARTSHWLPVIRGVPLSPEMKPFALESMGYPSRISQMPFPLSFGTESNLVIDNEFYRLIDPYNSISDFIKAINPRFMEAVINENIAKSTGLLSSAAQMDVVNSAWVRLRDSYNRPDAQIKVMEGLSTQNFQLNQGYWLRYQMESIIGQSFER